MISRVYIACVSSLQKQDSHPCLDTAYTLGPGHRLQLGVCVGLSGNSWRTSLDPTTSDPLGRAWDLGICIHRQQRGICCPSGGPLVHRIENASWYFLKLYPVMQEGKRKQDSRKVVQMIMDNSFGSTKQTMWHAVSNEGACDMCIYEQLNQVRTRLIDSSSIPSTEDPVNLSAGPGAHGCDVVK